MVACPECHESSEVEIVRDDPPWEDTPDGPSPRWAARCGDCGATWTLVDRL